MIAGSSAPEGTVGFPEVRPFEEETNTTLAVVATNARCTKLECRLLAESAHHGLVRAIHPSHTRHDGDIAFAAATGEVDAHLRPPARHGHRRHGRGGAIRGRVALPRTSRAAVERVSRVLARTAA